MFNLSTLRYVFSLFSKHFSTQSIQCTRSHLGIKNLQLRPIPASQNALEKVQLRGNTHTHTNMIRLCEMVPFKAYLFLNFFETRYHWWTIGADIGPNRSNLIIFSTSRQVKMKIQDIDLYEVPVPRIFKNTKGAEKFDKSSYTKIISTGYTVTLRYLSFIHFLF